MREKVHKVVWVVLLVISSFVLGYTLKPQATKRAMPPFMPQSTRGGQFTPPTGQKAPPLHFRR